MRLILLLLAAAVLCGCQTTRTAHLHQREVIVIANKVGAAHQEQLDRYRRPEAHFYASRGLWIVSFRQKVPYTYGRPETYHFFAVHVDDKTGKGTYEAGGFE